MSLAITLDTPIGTRVKCVHSIDRACSLTTGDIYTVRAIGREGYDLFVRVRADSGNAVWLCASRFELALEWDEVTTM